MTDPAVTAARKAQADPWHHPRRPCLVVDVAHLRTAFAAHDALEAKNQRLHDLVRHQRGALHDAELITDAEYAALAADSGSVARLEGYDAVRQERDEARANYKFMVDRAAETRLDGYRELGDRAAAMEAERDEARATLADLRRACYDAVPGTEATYRGELPAYIAESFVRIKDEARLDGVRAGQEAAAAVADDQTDSGYQAVLRILAIDPATVGAMHEPGCGDPSPEEYAALIEAARLDGVRRGLEAAAIACEPYALRGTEVQSVQEAYALGGARSCQDAIRALSAEEITTKETT